jgi:hypothetical protein
MLWRSVNRSKYPFNLPYLNAIIKCNYGRLGTRYSHSGNLSRFLLYHLMQWYEVRKNKVLAHSF